MALFEKYVFVICSIIIGSVYGSEVAGPVGLCLGGVIGGLVGILSWLIIFSSAEEKKLRGNPQRVEVHHWHSPCYSHHCSSRFACSQCMSFSPPAPFYPASTVHPSPSAPQSHQASQPTSQYSNVFSPRSQALRQSTETLSTTASGAPRASGGFSRYQVFSPRPKTH